MRIQTILMGMDWSAAATDAWSEACLIAKTFGSEVVLAHALPTSVSAAGPRDREEVELRAHELLRDLSVGEGAVSPRAIVDVGAAADVLLAATHEPPLVDLIVIGSSERTGFGRALLGSTAERVVRESPTPVWLVRPGRVHQEVKRILCAIDGVSAPASSESEEALRTAVFLCRTFVADLTVLNVVPAGADVAEGEALLRARLETIDLHGIATHLLVRAGKPAARIVEAAGDVSCDLLVMGTRGRTGLGQLLNGSTAERVIRAAPSSVLVVKKTS